MQSTDAAAQFRPELLAQAWQQPVARVYRQVGLLTQTPAAMCGPTSIAQVLRSCGIDVPAGQVLDGTPVRTFFGARIGGMSLDQVAEVLRIRSETDVEVLRDLELDALRSELARANDLGFRYIANFSRQPLFGWGGGHHSPLGAYLPDEDAVLVVDCNRRVGPWVASVPAFHKALNTRDPWMKVSRGLARLRVNG